MVGDHEKGFCETKGNRLSQMPIPAASRLSASRLTYQNGHDVILVVASSQSKEQLPHDSHLLEKALPKVEAPELTRLHKVAEVRKVDDLEVFGSLGPEVKCEDEVAVGGGVVDCRDLRLLEVKSERVEEDPLSFDSHEARHLRLEETSEDFVAVTAFHV